MALTEIYGLTLRLIAGAVPALVTAVFAGVIMLVALLTDRDRREYTLDVADRLIELAAVSMGVDQRAASRDLRQGKEDPSLGVIRQGRK